MARSDQGWHGKKRRKMARFTGSCHPFLSYRSTPNLAFWHSGWHRFGIEILPHFRWLHLDNLNLARLVLSFYRRGLAILADLCACRFDVVE